MHGIQAIGPRGLENQPLVLGTVNFSSYTNEADSFAMLDRALELGINHLIDVIDLDNPPYTMSDLSPLGKMADAMRDRALSRSGE